MNSEGTEAMIQDNNYELVEQLRLQNLNLQEKIYKSRLMYQTLILEFEEVKRISFPGRVAKILLIALKTYVFIKLKIIHFLLQVKNRGKNHGYSASFKPYKVKAIQSSQTKRPKVLHAIGNFRTGGSARLVVDLIEHLGHRFEQEVITGYLPDPPGYTGLKICAPPSNPENILSYLRKFEPDILHFHYVGDEYWERSVFKAAQECGCKVIENINIPIQPYISDSFNYYVYVSNYVKDEYGFTFLNEREITIYPGSDFTLFSRQEGTEIPDDCIGMVYRLDTDKLNEFSIDVFIKVVKRRRQTKVLIVGGGDYFDLYQDAVQRAGVSDAFTFTGYVSYDELPKLYAQMSVFVAPVWKESFGQVSPFAMSMGIPVVGYDIGALKEIIVDGNLLAHPGDSDGLADIIIKLLDDRQLRLKIGEKNSRRAKQLFSVEAMIESYNALYNRLLVKEK